MFERFLAMFRKPEGRIWDPWEEDRTGAVSDAEPIRDEEALRKWFHSKRSCPDCGGTSFYGGPEGGLAQNMLCAGCHSEYCIGPLSVSRVGEPRQGRLSVYGLDKPAV